MTRKTVWLGVAAVSTGLLVGAVVVAVTTVFPRGTIAIALGLVAFPLMGGMIVLRRPENRIGLLLVTSGFWFAAATFGLVYFWWGLETGPLPGADAAGWITVWAYWPAVASMAVLLAAFPPV